jgi:hypothetical protein
MLTNDDVTMMIKTFGTVFPQAQLWKVPEGLDLILLGSQERLPEPDVIRQRVAQLNRSNQPLLYSLSRGEKDIQAIVALPDVPFNTDDRPILEFHAARNLLAGDLSHLEREGLDAQDRSPSAADPEGP